MMPPGAIGAASKLREKQKMIRRFPIAAATLALSLTASASMAAEGTSSAKTTSSSRVPSQELP